MVINEPKVGESDGPELNREPWFTVVRKTDSAKGAGGLITVSEKPGFTIGSRTRPGESTGGLIMVIEEPKVEESDGPDWIEEP